MPDVRYEVLVDRTERPGKCSVLPLRDREDMRIVRFDRRRAIPALTGDVLLHPEGRLLPQIEGTVPFIRELPAAEAIVICAVDCNWRRLPTITARIEPPLPPLVRIPEGFSTAYRRRNQRDLDPAEGLATVEALFLAAAFLGHWDETLLEHCRMRAEFLEANAEAFQRYGLGPRGRGLPTTP
jgi:pre-rRNA-processing protein TSR3